MGKIVWTVATSLGGARSSMNYRLEECIPPGHAAMGHTVFPIHATHVPVNFIRVMSEYGNDTWQSLSLFSQYWHFMKFNSLPIYRHPTLLSATKEGFGALSVWCFSPSFPCTSGSAPVTQPETTWIHNRGPKYRTFSWINDILNSFADSQSAHWNGHVLYVVHPIIERAKLHISILVLKYATKMINLLLKGTRVRWSAVLFCMGGSPSDVSEEPVT